MNVISNNVRLPYTQIKGSIQARRALVSRLNEQFFDSFVKLTENKKVRANDFKQVFLNLLPEKKNIEIKKINIKENFSAASDYIYNEKSENIIGLTLELPFLSSKMGFEDLPTLMHENTHILSTLVHPKHTALTQKLNKADKYKNSYNDWYQNVLYTDEKITDDYTVEDMVFSVKEKTLHFLAGKSNRDKIDYLQDAKYQLEQEQEAFCEQLKYAQKLKELGLDVLEEDLIDGNKSFFFTEKIEVLNSILLDVLINVRKKNSLKIKAKLLKQ